MRLLAAVATTLPIAEGESDSPDINNFDVVVSAQTASDEITAEKAIIDIVMDDRAIQREPLEIGGST